MRVINQSIETISIDQLQPHPENPRKGDLVTIAESIDANGFYGAIVAQKSTGYILAGNHRYMAAKKKGAREIPVAWVDVDEDQAKHILLADNRTSDLGGYDEELLAELLQDVNASIGLHGTGYNESDLDALIGDNDSLDQPDEAAESSPSNIKQRCSFGDLWQLGDHRLLCGDSTQFACLQRVTGGQIADYVFSDPPYGIKIVKRASNKVGAGKCVEGRWVEANQYAEIKGDDSTESARLFYEAAQKSGINKYILWGGNYFTHFVPPSMCWLVWDKQNTGDFADVELAWCSEQRASKLYPWLWNGMTRLGSRRDELVSRIHPTQKPVGLFVRIFQDFPFDSCLDGFLGSGSTLIACEKANRTCFGIEYSVEYCDLILQRWENYTGGEAALLERLEE